MIKSYNKLINTGSNAVLQCLIFVLCILKDVVH